MNSARTRSPLPNLDILALSLLMCLLAAVVSLLAAQPKRTPLPAPLSEPAPPVAADPAPDWGGLQAMTDGLAARAGVIERQHASLSHRLTWSLAERENAAMRSRIAEASEKVQLREQIRAARAEADRAEKALEDAAGRAASGSVALPRLAQGHRGPYVLIECIEGASIVYPGKSRVAVKAAQPEVDALAERIAATGFVVFVVRPGGWYLDSFDDLRPRVYRALAEIEKRTGRRIGRSVVPIEASESIAELIPNGGTT